MQKDADRAFGAGLSGDAAGVGLAAEGEGAAILGREGEAAESRDGVEPPLAAGAAVGTRSEGADRPVEQSAAMGAPDILAAAGGAGVPEEEGEAQLAGVRRIGHGGDGSLR